MANQNLLNDPDTIDHVIEYRGDIISAINKIDYASVWVQNNKTAIISAKLSDIPRLLDAVPEIIYWSYPVPYSFESISPQEAANVVQVQINPTTNLRGDDTLIGIVDTGIDYLNKEFTSEDGKTRIECIWDQSMVNESDSSIPYGKIFYRDQINDAIAANANGQDPYAIVPSRDEYGHGTNMAGLSAARGYNPDVIGVAPNADLVIVKAKQLTLETLQLVQTDVPVYIEASVLTAIDFLVKKALELNKPMAILVSLGSNTGSHSGISVVEQYIREISDLRGIVVVNSGGNEGNTDTHVRGRIPNPGAESSIELKVADGQPTFGFQIWVDKPNKFSISIVSPSGEVIPPLQAKLQQSKEIRFVLERSIIVLNIDIAEERTGRQLIAVEFKDPSPGIWTFKLTAEITIEGIYDAWLPKRILLQPETKFLNASSECTVTIPGTEPTCITVAYYDQNNDSIVASSSRGYTAIGDIKPDIAAGGVNAVTTGLDNQTVVISGSSVAGAVTAGACSLILQWGIVDKNDPLIFANKMRSYLIVGARRIERFTYPNKEWGYGLLDVYGIFKALRSVDKEFDNVDGDLYFRYPEDF